MPRSGEKINSDPVDAQCFGGQIALPYARYVAIPGDVRLAFASGDTADVHENVAQGRGQTVELFWDGLAKMKMLAISNLSAARRMLAVTLDFITGYFSKREFRARSGDN
jgi:hypothetical protein